MNTGDTVKYAYITTASSMPASTDSTTIYFDENEKKISVGNVKFDGGTLPAATSADEGKVLMVDSNGDYVLGTVSASSPIPYAGSNSNSVATVTSVEVN